MKKIEDAEPITQEQIEAEKKEAEEEMKIMVCGANKLNKEIERQEEEEKKAKPFWRRFLGR